MARITATYMRQLTGHGIWLGEEPVSLEADCEQAGDLVLVAFTEETLAMLAELGLDTEELVGCEEAVEEAFWQHEMEQARLSYLRQRLGKVEAA